MITIAIKPKGDSYLIEIGVDIDNLDVIRKALVNLHYESQDDEITSRCEALIKRLPKIKNVKTLSK
jgi:hypothetical protein